MVTTYHISGLLGTYVNGGSYDHVVVPGGQCESTTTPAGAVIMTFSFDRYCGTQLGCGTNAIGTAEEVGTVCTNQKPFKISVLTDGLEYHFATAASEAGAPRNQGFSLSEYK